MRLPLFILALLLLAGAPLAVAAITTPAGSGLSLATLDEFREKGIPDEQWPSLLETLGNEEQRESVRSLVSEQKPFPGARLMSALTHPRLAVRLGALELLEDAAGESFGFDPWQENPAGGANTEALARWKTWVEKGGTATPAGAIKLTDETFRVIAQEIASGQRDRAERAMQRLDSFGLAAIAHLENFLKEQPGLEGAPRALLKCAEYRVVLRQALPKQAAALARELALGTPEAQSTALAALGSGGPGVLPVLSEFLTAPDPLVRESAVDAAITAGDKQSATLLTARLKEETAQSVLHALLRGVGSLATSGEELAAVAGFLNHESENIVVTALEALGASSEGNFETALKGKLSDTRWRVRAAALEAIGKRNLTGLKNAVTERLKDDDLFVRVTAVHTLKHIGGNGASAELLAEFERQNDLKAPILEALFSDSRTPPPARIWELLPGAPPETILQCLDTLVSRDDHGGKRAPYAAPLAHHANADVAASALRILAGRGRYTAYLLEALQSKDPVKVDAVLDNLHLPPGFFAGSVAAAPAAPTASNPALDQLYDTFHQAPPKGAPHAARAVAAGEEAPADPTAFRAVLTGFLRDGSPQQRLQAALSLSLAKDKAALQFLASSYDTLSPLDRRAIAGVLEGMPDWSDPLTKDLAVRALRDATDDVRETAVEAWLQKGESETLLGLLDELARPGSLLDPSDIYGWQLDRMLGSDQLRRTVQAWSRRILADPAARNAHKVLALVLLGRVGGADAATLEPLLSTPNAVLRRAAYRALGRAGVEQRLDRLLGDESALVRAVLPFLIAPTNYTWQHYFDEANHVSDTEDFDSNERNERSFGAWSGQDRARNGGKVTDALLAALEKLTRDPSEMVRFEAMFSLLRLGRPVDPSTLAGLVAAQPERAQARERIGNYLERNYQRLGQGYGVLMPLAKDIRDDDLPKILKHFGLEKKAAFSSFAALAKLAPAVSRVPDNAVAPPPSDTKPDRATAPFRVLFFHKPGCRDCARVREMLARHAPNFPLMTVEEFDIEERTTVLLNEALSARFHVKDTLHQATPGVFTQGGVLLRDQITFPALGDLLRATAALPVDEQWAATSTEETVAAEQTITSRYATMSLVFVGLAGLADGINPCAFATIIFLLSYLHVARRSPREILAVGAAFISAVFLAYFVAGLGLAQVLSQISALQSVRALLNYLLAGIALVLAILSFRDAQLAARGEFGEMTLQLPGALKEQIRTAIRTSAKASRFVIAAFLAGLVVSLLELACTGQVYLPTILYMVRAGQTSAYAYLLAYNLAFILPLIFVFILSWRGMRSDALVRFQKNHTALVKSATGFLFLLLTAFLLFGHLFIPQFTVPQ